MQTSPKQDNQKVILSPNLLIIYIYDRRGAFEPLKLSFFYPNLALYKGPFVIHVFYKHMHIAKGRGY